MRTRKEQIADLENQFGEEGTFAFLDDRDAATKHILEAEQRGYERARAECAADTRRLDWLGQCCIHVYDPKKYDTGIGCGVCTLSHKPEAERNLRAAIDEAMEGGNG